MEPRWEGDERGEGVAAGRALAPGVEELAAALQRENWVAEDPEAHLLPHLQLSCDRLPFELLSASTAEDGTFEVRLRWRGEGSSLGAIRQAVFALVGGVAESATYVRQRREPLQFEVATGILADGTFAPHGHTLRISVER
jgi:hypothetical protein